MDENDSIYTVYLLTDGIATDVWDGDDYFDALTHFEAAEYREHNYRSTCLAYAETTIHLYEPAAGIMHAEVCVPRK